jgi:hypothetical protein
MASAQQLRTTLHVHWGTSSYRDVITDHLVLLSRRHQTRQRLHVAYQRPADGTGAGKLSTMCDSRRILRPLDGWHEIRADTLAILHAARHGQSVSFEGHWLCRHCARMAVHLAGTHTV